MIWLTWRQFRVQAVTAVAGLAVLAIYLVVLGLQLRHSYDVHVHCDACSLGTAERELQRQYSSMLELTGLLVVVVPVLVGAFWGAPLIAREIETGTHRLIWNQSVTRARWLAVKLALVTLAGAVVSGALSLLLTWAASPYDRLLANRFEPLVFPTRNVAPLGYAVFAVLLGITVGLLVRRTVPAMAVTLAVFVVLQILLPTAIRPHLEPPVTRAVALTAETPTEADVNISRDGGVSVEAYQVPGAWVLSSDNLPVLDASGAPVNKDETGRCLGGGGDPGSAYAKTISCIAKLNLHFNVEYQPANRYWAFQWLETGGYLVLAALLAGFAFWRIPRGLS